jgi:hypothetical protein
MIIIILKFHAISATYMSYALCAWKLNFRSDSGSFSPNEAVSMRGTNIWGNSDEVAENSNSL